MLEARERREEDFWDRRAQSKAGQVEYFGNVVNTNDRKIIALHEFAASLLGDLEGKKVLDCGSGYGAFSCYLAGRGAQVTAVDISEESIAISREWFRKNGVDGKIKTHAGSLHKLDFESGSFDFAVGSCILHHLDLGLFAPELNRVLKKGGKAAFVENNGTNPLLMFFRNKVLAPLGLRRGSPDEYPMDEEKLAVLQKSFPEMAVHFPEMIFLRLAGSFFFNDFGPVRRALENFDTLLARALPSAGKWSYFNVIEVRK